MKMVTAFKAQRATGYPRKNDSVCQFVSFEDASHELGVTFQCVDQKRKDNRKMKREVDHFPLCFGHILYF